MKTEQLGEKDGGGGGGQQWGQDSDASFTQDTFIQLLRGKETGKT